MFAKMQKRRRAQESQHYKISERIGEGRYLCLHEDCANNRLLQAIQQEDHPSHQIILVHPRVSPFSQLSINKDQPRHDQIHKELTHRTILLQKMMNQVQSQVSSFFDQLRFKIIEPLATIAGTYKQEMKDQARLLMIERNHPQKFQIEVIAQKIQFLKTNQKKINMEFFNHVQRFSENLLLNTKNNLKHYLQKFDQEISKQVYGGNAKKINIFDQNQPKVQIKEKDKPRKVKQPQPKREIQPKRKIQTKSRKLVPVDDRMIPQEKMPINNENESKEVKKREKKEKKRQFDKQMQVAMAVQEGMQRKKAVKHKKQKKQKSAMVAEQSMKAESKQLNPVPMDEPKRQLKLEQQPQDEIVIEPHQKCIIDDAHSIQMLLQDELLKIKQIRVQNLHTDIQQFFIKLSQMKNLQKIVIFQNVICQKANRIKLMQSLPAQIREIIMNCSNDFDEKCVEQLSLKSKEKIRIIQYLYDIRNQLKRYDQNLYLRTAQKGIRVQPLQYRHSNDMAYKFPNLRNFWIKNKNANNKNRHSKINFQKLESLVVGQLDDSKVVVLDPIPQNLGQNLLKTRSLRSLSLLDIKMTTQFFQNFISRNKMLQTLYCQYCQGPTEDAMHRIIETNSKIKNFSLKECKDINGGFIQQIPHAQFFSIDQSQIQNTKEENQDNKKYENPFKSFEKNNSLIYFSVYSNGSFHNDLFRTLRNSSHSLKSLNIGMTCVTDQCISYFDYFKELEYLVLDQNHLSAAGILEICSKLPKLTKLSLNGYNGNDNKGEMSMQLLKSIGQKLPKLRHLAIRDCCPIEKQTAKQEYEQFLTKFNSLKTVETDLKVGTQFINTLKLAGITVMEGDDQMFIN